MIDRHPIKVCDMKVSRKCHARVDRLSLCSYFPEYMNCILAVFLLFTDHSGWLSSSFYKNSYERETAFLED